MMKVTFLSQALLLGFALSFVGGNGCFGGEVSLGNNSSAGAAGKNDNVSGLAGNGQAATDNMGAETGGSAPAASDLTLAVDAQGQVSAPAFGIAGPIYPISDGLGPDGSSASGDCELAGHSANQCASVLATTSGPPSFVCTQGRVEAVLSVVGAPGTPDYGAMWGAGVAFNFLQGSSERQPYDASAHGVIGFAFDLDRVPPRGLRVEVPTATTINEPAAWKPYESPYQNLTSPVRAGRNIVFFQELAPLPFYANQSVPDPTQLLSVQFHVPSSNLAADYDFCISNLSLVLGTPTTLEPMSNEGCLNPLVPDHGFAYDASTGCVSPYSTVLDCSSLGVSEGSKVPSTPAIENLPCVRRLADGALFLALDSKTGPLGWQTLPSSAWPRLSPRDWADCTADEAAIVSAAPICTILPI